MPLGLIALAIGGLRHRPHRVRDHGPAARGGRRLRRHRGRGRLAHLGLRPRASSSAPSASPPPPPGSPASPCSSACSCSSSPATRSRPWPRLRAHDDRPHRRRPLPRRLLRHRLGRRRRASSLPSKAAGAIAIMFTGLTAANVLGVPFGTFLGQQFGWRSTFWAISAIGVDRPRRHRDARAEPAAPTAPAPSLRRELARLPVRPGLALARRDRARLRRHVRRVHLHRLHAHRGERLRLERGAVAARALRRRPRRRQLDRRTARRPLDRRHPARASSPRSLVVLVALRLARLRAPSPRSCSSSPWAASVSAPCPPCRAASCATPTGAPTLASGANIAAFNLGNALGAWIGGLTIAAGLGYTSPIWVGAAITARRARRHGRGRCRPLAGDGPPPSGPGDRAAADTSAPWHPSPDLHRTLDLPPPPKGTMTDSPPSPPSP